MQATRPCKPIAHPAASPEAGAVVVLYNDDPSDGERLVSDQVFLLRPGQMTFEELHAYWRQARPVELDPEARPAVAASAETVARIVEEGRRVYGISTGFGSLARRSIPKDQVAELQRRLVRSHQAGVGEPLALRVVRLIILLKLGSLGRGHSGIRLKTLDLLLGMLNADLLPVIPAQGSVGASGDLAPLAALAAPLMGEGEVFLRDERLPAAEGLRRVGLEPLELAAKEGLALLNGSQVSCALALDGLFRGLDVFAGAVVSGAMSTDAALGSDVPFFLLGGEPFEDVADGGPQLPGVNRRESLGVAFDEEGVLRYDVLDAHAYALLVGCDALEHVGGAGNVDGYRGHG